MQRDRMKLSFLRQINACICLDRYEGGEGLLCNGLILCFFANLNGMKKTTFAPLLLDTYADYRENLRIGRCRCTGFPRGK
ncbi:hypothetical protein CS374_00540 [Porphyromonas gingivalis]|nr:hypothetical protein CS374_00540 [Porphyromonas gingivalis]